MAELKDMLKFYREREDLSQAELAEKIGVTPAAIGNYESGLRKPKMETEEAIADFFNISLDNLRGIDSEKKPIPQYSPELLDLIELYSQLTQEQKKSVMALLHSFVN